MFDPSIFQIFPDHPSCLLVTSICSSNILPSNYSNSLCFVRIVLPVFFVEESWWMQTSGWTCGPGAAIGDNLKAPGEWGNCTAWCSWGYKWWLVAMVRKSLPNEMDIPIEQYFFLVSRCFWHCEIFFVSSYLGCEQQNGLLVVHCLNTVVASRDGKIICPLNVAMESEYPSISRWFTVTYLYM